MLLVGEEEGREEEGREEEGREEEGREEVVGEGGSCEGHQQMTLLVRSHT